MAILCSHYLEGRMIGITLFHPGSVIHVYIVLTGMGGRVVPVKDLVIGRIWNTFHTKVPMVRIWLRHIHILTLCCRFYLTIYTRALNYESITSNHAIHSQVKVTGIIDQ